MAGKLGLLSEYSDFEVGYRWPFKLWLLKSPEAFERQVCLCRLSCLVFSG